MTPEQKAVARQPYACIDQAIRNTNSPPSAPPNWSAESARARRFSNHWMIATLTRKLLNMLAPSATTTKAA